MLAQLTSSQTNTITPRKALREKRLYSENLWAVFPDIWTEYGDLL